jgi:lipoprotein-anchoring transpeptidase ErfK/SrfK
VDTGCGSGGTVAGIVNDSLTLTNGFDCDCAPDSLLSLPGRRLIPWVGGAVGRVKVKASQHGSIMHLSRWLLAGLVAFSLAATPQPAQAGSIVGFSGDYSPGTVVVRTNQRSLYYVLGNGKAVRYSVGVGRAGKQWTGTAMITGKHIRPAWAPPADVKRDRPNLPALIPGGSPKNPMGAAALTLSGGEYAIHGTNSPGSIGGFVSYGCIRMHNRDILDLFGRVGPGTTVVVTR